MTGRGLADGSIDPDERPTPRRAPLDVVALFNATSGGEGGDDRVAAATEALAAAGLRVDVRVVDGNDLVAAMCAAASSNADTLVVGGGDGTLSAAAACLVGTDTALGVLPLGTFNHFAKDLGIPLGLEAAAQTVAAGFVRSVDVASVNDRFFVNNSSIGLYPRVVRDREEQRARLGRGKWPAFLLAIWSALRRYPLLDVHCQAGTESLHCRTPFVFVGNNRYSFSGLAFGDRPSLREGRLSLHLANRTNRLGLLRLALRALAGRLYGDPEIESLVAAEAVVRTRKRRIHVSTDGEVDLLTPPLHYRIHPRALRVLVPAPREESG